MGFVIKKIVVHGEPTRVRAGESHYNMIRDKWDVRNLLEVCEIFRKVCAIKLLMQGYLTAWLTTKIFLCNIHFFNYIFVICAKCLKVTFLI